MTPNQAKKQAIALMSQHGLHIWQFVFDRARRRHGYCRHPVGVQPGIISLSIFFVQRNDAETIQLTLLHEIAHALVGPGHGHDSVWRRKCLEIGGDGKRCGLADMPKGAWSATCGTCGHVYTRIRRPKSLTGYCCRKCGRGRGALVWRRSQCGERH